MHLINRRNFVAAVTSIGATALSASQAVQAAPRVVDSIAADDAWKVSVQFPRLRIPLSFIIDDSTCLVNMGKYCMPQFKTAWPDRTEYDQPWRSWPDEIPDEFLQRFGSWCAEQGVKGKFSIVPFPACVGRLDRELPGWSQQDLQASLKLVRDLIVPHWDIHPEMITHTRVIDLKTGHPIRDINTGTMENSFPQEDKSVDELAAYLAYALRILKNCDIPCEGITTPGGFGNRVKNKLPTAVFEAVRDVYGTELPHYFKYISERDEPTEPRLEDVRDRDTDAPRVTVNVPAGTGDWFGGWDGARTPEGDKYSTPDARSGRMIELLEQGKPTVMFCHWAGLYGNGTEEGFRQMQRIITAVNGRFGSKTVWMKTSEMARYWAAKELTKLSAHEAGVSITAPFACRDFTLRIEGANITAAPMWVHGNERVKLEEVNTPDQLASNRFCRVNGQLVVCIDLKKGSSQLEIK